MLDLGRIERLEAEMAVGQCLNAGRIIEQRPLGPQRGDGIALAFDFGSKLRQLLCPYRGFELDRVDAARRDDQRHHHDWMDETHPHRRFPWSTAASDGTPLPALPCRRGKGGRRTPAAARAGASVRSAARSLAERARGFSSISASSGVTGRRVSARKVAACGILSGIWREPPLSPLRIATNVLTIRSSSEWNETTTSRPAGFRTRSAAARPPSSSCSSSLTNSRSAWNVRVAG